MIRAWMQDAVPPSVSHKTRPGHWIAEDGWPAARIKEKTMHLTPGSLADELGQGSVAVRTHPLLGAGNINWNCGGAGGSDQPGDQQIDDALSVTFERGIESSFDIFGTGRVTLRVSADKPLAFLCARLCEVQPDGASTRITYGALNLTHRDSHETPQALVPGEIYDIRIKLNDIAHRFGAGNILRLSLSTTLWPMIWPSPDAATVTLHLEGCTLRLPERGPVAEDADLKPFAAPEAGPAGTVTVLTPGRPFRSEVAWDVAGGIQTITLVGRGARVRHDDSGWEYGADSMRQFTLSPADPLSALVSTQGKVDWSREGVMQVTGHFAQQMSATVSEFVLETSMRVTENDELVSDRTWSIRIPRDLV